MPQQQQDERNRGSEGGTNRGAESSAMASLIGAQRLALLMRLALALMLINLWSVQGQASSWSEGRTYMRQPRPRHTRGMACLADTQHV